MKTIRELAEELDVSKTTVRNHIKNLPDNLSVTKKGNMLYLDSDVEAFIKDKVKKVSDNLSETNAKDIEVIQERMQMLKDRNEELENDNEYLRQQMSEKNKQIEDYARLLDQQQQLNLRANQELEDFKERKNREVLEYKEQEEKKGFWARLLGN